MTEKKQQDVRKGTQEALQGPSDSDVSTYQEPTQRPPNPLQGPAMLDYFEWESPGGVYYEIERDSVSGVVLVQTTEFVDSVTVGVFRFEHGALVEAIGCGVLPDALADEIEERWANAE